MAYGYMRAFDEFLRREDPALYHDCYQSTEAIIQKRFAIYRREAQLLDSLYLSRTAYPMPSARNPGNIMDAFRLTQAELSELRAMKRDLWQLVFDRFTRFGPRSLPKGFGTPHTPRRERVFDWWEHWESLESHRDPGTYELNVVNAAALLPGRPFDRQFVWDPDTGTEELEVNEPEVPQDQGFYLAMAF